MCSENEQGCTSVLQDDTLKCSCGVWAHRTCLPVEYSPIDKEIWTCGICSNLQFPIYLAWIN